MKNNDLKELVDRDLSGLVWDGPKRRKVLQAVSGEEKPVKKISTTFILIAAIVCLSVTALAAGLVFSQKYDAVRLANRALEEKYGLTPDLQSLLWRDTKENEDGSATVTYAVFAAQDLPADRIGVYTVTVKGNRAEASWSHDGESTEGGLQAEAYGKEQLQRISYDYANAMDEMNRLGIMTLPSSGMAPNPALKDGQITEWTEEDQRIADEAEALAAEEDRKRLADLAEAESKGTLSLEEAVRIGREAVAQEYGLNAEQAGKLAAEESCFCVSEDGGTRVDLLFWLWQSDNGDQFTEKDGQYWVTVDLKDGTIEDIVYDSGLAANG